MSSIAFGARAGNRTRVEASTTPHDNRYTTRAASCRAATAILSRSLWPTWRGNMASKKTSAKKREKKKNAAADDMFGGAFGGLDQMDAPAEESQDIKIPEKEETETLNQ